MESPSAASWLSSTRLYMITRVSAGYGWVNPRPPAPLISKQSLLLCFLLCGLSSIWHQRRRSNHLHRPAHIGKNSMKSLLIVFLALWQKMEAAYYDNIIEQQRIEPEFFRMGFYGRKFPFFLRVRLGPSRSHPAEVDRGCSRPRRRPPSHDVSLDPYFVLVTSDKK